MRLTHRYVLACCLVVVISGMVLAVTFDAHRTDVVDSAETSVEDRAELSAATLDNRLSEQQRTVSLGTTNPALADHGTEAQQRMLGEFIERSAFDGASVVDETGDVQVLISESADPDDLAAENISDRAYVRHALAGEEYISDPFRAETGYDVVVISAPIRNEDGAVVGALNGAYHLDETELFDPLAGDDREGTTVEANNETLYTDADRFDETISAGATLEATDWTVTAHRDRDAVSSTVTRLAIGQLLSGALLLGSVATFSIWIYRSNIRWIEQLRERLRALERREYDAGPTIAGAEEWARIDDALSRLGETLARREQMLLVLNRILRHNLRNSLNVVAGRATDLEGDDRESAAEIRRVTAELLVLADRARTTEELLDPVAEANQQTDVAAIVRERVAAFETGTVEGSRTVEDVTVTGPTHAIAACDEKIAVAIDELLANVADHAGPDPTVVVTVAIDEDRDRVLVRIDDDGPGIPDDQISVITGDRAISQINHTGGIGLWLVDWLLGRYDGRLVIPRSANDHDGRCDGGSAGDEGAVDTESDADIDTATETAISTSTTVRDETPGTTDEDATVDRPADGATVVVEVPRPSNSCGE